MIAHLLGSIPTLPLLSGTPAASCRGYALVFNPFNTGNGSLVLVAKTCLAQRWRDDFLGSDPDDIPRLAGENPAGRFSLAAARRHHPRKASFAHEKMSDSAILRQLKFSQSNRFILTTNGHEMKE